MTAEAGFGPEARPRAIVLTFDNLGEANALERGTWSADTPLGDDPSVRRALPRLLDALADSGLTATFFVEAINCELNPSALHEIAARGHELGVHGWRHEQWAQLDATAERALLQRSTEAFTQAGIAPRGFRPPGGELTPRTEPLLRRHGYAWVSPVGGEPAVVDGLVSVPFSWELVDAYHLMERFAELRRSRGDDAAPASAATVADRLAAALRDGDDGGLQTVILHPFLMLDEEWLAGVRRLLGLIAELSESGAAWVVPGGVFADWLGRSGHAVERSGRE
jgi:peptidoglycan/xylan/chitin deacetylase (PgdA/CDA1 family)